MNFDDQQATAPSHPTLADAERRFRKLADSAPVLIWQTDEHGAVFMNAEYVRFIGRPLSELVGMGWADSLHPEDAPAYIANYLHAFARRDRYEAQFRFRRADGEYRWMKTVGLPQHDTDGGFVGYIGVSFDITDVKRIEQASRESEAWFREVADVAPGITWVTTPDGTCTFLSQRWYELTGQVPPEGLGFGWLDATHPDDKQHTGEQFQLALAQRSAFDFEYRLRLADGSYGWFVDSGRPRFDAAGTFLGHVGHVFNVSERKRAEIEREQAARVLRDAARRKDDFIATLAHELRNPLAPIRTGLHLVRRDPSSAAAQQTLAMMERQVGSMVRLIDDLMDVARISRGRLELQFARVDVRSVLDEAVVATSPLYEAKLQQLTVHKPPEPVVAEVDAVRLVQVVSNLLTNASRYSAAGTRVSVRLERQAERARVRVADEGFGIPKERLETVFEPFSTFNSDVGRPGSGLGIGLALVRRLTEMHGGHVSVASEGLGHGSTFTVDVPLVRDGAPVQVPAAPADRQHVLAPARRILVVDDNEDAAQSLAAALALAGHQVHTVHSGADAISRAVEVLPEVVLLDIGLPDMSGYDVARGIRAQSALPVKLIALTGWGAPNDKERALAAGFDAHLTKPAALDDIEALLL